MAGLKLLLDTNVIIALEDFKPLSVELAALSKKAQVHGLTLFVDEAASLDIRRDHDRDRRERTLSHLARFPSLDEVAHSDETRLIAKFGPIKNENDRCDVLMLDSLAMGIVDFLISEDIGVHKRAAKAGIADRVFRVIEALHWITRTFEPNDFRLQYVVAKKAHQIQTSDPIFASLREDYAGFDRWFDKCRKEHRDCWIVEIYHRLAGLAIRKDESRLDPSTGAVLDRILKLCTFKISPEFRGEKLGEQLLKKALWFAQANSYDLVYLTAFPKHAFLLELFAQFGFAVTGELQNGELVIERRMCREAMIEIDSDEAPLAKDFAVYPRYYSGNRVRKFVVPIQEPFHKTLFPEIAEAPPLPLFPEERFVAPPGTSADRTPGNTIRKVYVCRAATRQLQPGDVLVFYLSKAKTLLRSQSLTTVGIVESIQLSTSIVDLMRAVGRRSVYSQADLTAMTPMPDSPVLVIDFLLIGHYQPALGLPRLIEKQIFNSRPPQSIAILRPEAFAAVEQLTRVASG